MDKLVGELLKIAKDLTGGNMGSANKEYLDGLSSSEKSKILKAISNHYGVSTSVIESEMEDRDAEALYEYLAFDRSMAMRVYRDFKSMKIAKELMSAEEWPEPKGVNESAWEKWKEQNADDVERILKSGGASIKRFNPKDPFYNYIEAVWKGKPISLGLTGDSIGRNTKALTSLLSNMRKVMAAYEQLSRIPAPFHSDIHRSVKTHFGGGAGKHMAYSVITDWLREDGKRITTG